MLWVKCSTWQLEKESSFGIQIHSPFTCVSVFSDHSMVEFLQYQDQTSQYYSDLMNKLERMNSTLGFLLHYLDNMQSRIEARLHMIQGYLGWAGQTWGESKDLFLSLSSAVFFHFSDVFSSGDPGLSLTAMWTCVAHTGYFVLCAVLLTFLRCPGFSRAMLLLTVPLNTVAEVNQQPALDLTSLSLLLLTLSLGKTVYKEHKPISSFVFYSFFTHISFHACRSLVCEPG